MSTTVRAWAPGRVNLIGDHTDYTGGLVLPMAVHLGTTVELERGGDVVELRSQHEHDPALVAIDVVDPSTVSPPWARYVAGVVAEVRPSEGGRGTVTSTLPIGAGLSSSAALEVAIALALGVDAATPRPLAELCQRAEQRASGVPCGIMDQLSSAAGVEGHALLIDCRSIEIEPIALPDDVVVVAVDSGQARTLAGSAYAERRAGCEAAEAVIGPLRDATLDDVARLPDALGPLARHVITENERVRAFAGALQRGDVGCAGALMYESHASLRDDFAVSTTVLDALVERLRTTPGVLGARLTGGGFGGAVVALCEAGTVVEGGVALRPSPGARLLGA